MSDRRTAVEPRWQASAELRVAIVGAGRMARHHAEAVARSSIAARLVAVVDPDENARRALLARYPGAAGFSTIEDLLAATDVDVVHVTTPPETHERLTEFAIQSGCHVYVEKPFASSTERAESLIALAERHGVRLCAGHQMLFEKPARRTMELLGALGTIVHVESYFSFQSVRRSRMGTKIPKDLQLLDILPHAVYLLLAVLKQWDGDSSMEVRAIEIGPQGTVHALVHRGGITGALVVTLEGRPIESYLRVVGTNGIVHADFVRGTVLRLIGPGTSTLDKILAPFELAGQIVTGSVGALTRRILRRQRSYPGLVEILEAFYEAVRANGPNPLSSSSLIEATCVWQQVADALRTSQVELRPSQMARFSPAPEGRGVLITGGTGFFGKAITRVLARDGHRVRVAARRLPEDWERVPGVDYWALDVADDLPASALKGVEVLIHCAAATSGGWDAHQRNSIEATDRVLHAAAAAGVKQVLHVSSMMVLAIEPDQDQDAIDEDSPLESRPQRRGPYAWGKTESERLARRRARELGLDMRVVRPGAIVDSNDFDPPGALGRRLGRLFIAVGSPQDRVGTVDLAFAARTVGWMACHFEDSPSTLNLLDCELPTKGELVDRLRRSRPSLRVLWLPRSLLWLISKAAIVAQKILRPMRPAIDAAEVFAVRRCRTTMIERLASRVESHFAQESADRRISAVSGESSLATVKTVGL